MQALPARIGTATYFMKMTALESPFTGGPVEEITYTQTCEMRGQQLVVEGQRYRCLDTGELFSTGEQDEQFLAALHRQYRERNQVPSAAMLKRRREELNISAREASQMLGFGINQFSLYEGGELPSESNTLLLQFFCDPQALQKLVSSRLHALPARLLEKLRLALQAAPQIYGGRLVVPAMMQPAGYIYLAPAEPREVARANEEDILRMYNNPQARKEKQAADYISS